MTPSAHEGKPILVLGGTGKTGRRVAERLTARGIRTRLGSRSGQPPFDWEDQATWAPVLQGVGAAYITYFPDLAVPGAPEAVHAFAEVALEQDVRRLVLLSGRGEEEAQRSERKLQESGADWTVVRCAWFMQNFSEAFLVDSIRRGAVVLPAGDKPEPFVDADDIADVAVATLTQDGHSGQLYELTGPRLLTFAQVVDEIAAATGTDVRYVQISNEEFASALASAQVPPELRQLLGYLFNTVLDGRNAYVSDGVQRALGRAPRDFTDFARDAANAGLWTA